MRAQGKCPPQLSHRYTTPYWPRPSSLPSLGFPARHKSLQSAPKSTFFLPRAFPGERPGAGSRVGGARLEPGICSGNPTRLPTAAWGGGERAGKAFPAGSSPCSSTSCRDLLSRESRASRGAWSFLTFSHRSSVLSSRPEWPSSSCKGHHTLTGNIQGRFTHLTHTQLDFGEGSGALASLV